MPFIDNDGDGLDDSSGLPQAQHEQMEAARGFEAPDPESWIGYEPTPEEREDTREGIRYADESHPARRNDPEWLAMQEALRHEGADTTATEQRQRAEDYAGSETRTGDLDAGRGGRYGDADREYREAYEAAQRGYRGGEEEIPQWVRDTRGIPIFGGPADAWMADYESRRQQRGWDELDRWMPSADDLAVEYSEEGEIAGPERSELAGARADQGSIEAQRAALGAVEDVWRSGGMTAADRARQQQAYEAAGMQARAQREADTAALQARGIGGGGAQVASMLSGQQGAAQSRSAADAQMLIDAQRRALQAMGMSGQMAGQMRGQSFEEEATRRGAADDFNRYNTDYLRGREERNTRYRHQTGESRSRARQQQYENRERQQAGRTNQWAQGASGARQDQARNDENARGVVSALGELIDF